jgi:hypothetical protein
MSDYRGEPLDEVLERFAQSSGRARDLAGELHGNVSKALCERTPRVQRDARRAEVGSG